MQSPWFAEKLEQATMALVAKGFPVDQVAECLKLPLSLIKSWTTQQAGHSTSGGCLA